MSSRILLPASSASRIPSSVSGTRQSASRVYTDASTLPSDCPCLTSMILRGLLENWLGREFDSLKEAEYRGLTFGSLRVWRREVVPSLCDADRGSTDSPLSLLLKAQSEFWLSRSCAVHKGHPEHPAVRREPCSADTLPVSSHSPYH